MSTLINGIFIFIIGISLFALIQKWMASIQWMISNLDYQCARCGGYIYLPTWQAVTEIHFMGKKWARCPHCGEMTWSVPIRK